MDTEQPSTIASATPKTPKGKRITPVPITAGSEESSFLVTKESNENDLEEGGNRGKRKDRAPAHRDDIGLQSQMRAPTKRYKSGKSPKFNISALSPYGFLLSSPPIHYAPVYVKLCEWIENAVNGDFTLNERPVHIDFTKDLPPLPKDVEEKMKLLVEELNNPKKLDDNWTKFTIADKILSLVGDDDWHERNLPWMKLQQDVWWVKKANKWFTKTQCSTCEDYIQVGFSALILELWYRFVWCKHTIAVHAKLVQQQSQQPHDMDANTSSMNDVDMLADDDILDKSDLGEGDEEMEEEDDSSDEDDDKIEVDLDADMEVDFSRAEASSPNRTSNSSPPTGGIDSRSGSSGESPPIVADNTSSMIVEPADGQMHGSSGVDGLNSNHASENNADENSAMEESSSDPVPTLQMICEEEYGANSSTESPVSSIPSVVSLFFSHPRISQAIDDIESVLLGGEEADWNISRCIDVFVDLVEHRNIDLKIAKPLARKQIRNRIDHLYQSEFIPFLKNVGIKLAGSDDRVWKVQPECARFYEVTLVSMFANISQDGNSPSHNFLQLFPRLFLSADPRSQTYISQVTHHIHAILQAKGKITPEIDGLITLLDRLIDEKNTIMKQVAPQSMDDDDDDEGTPQASQPTTRAPSMGPAHQLLLNQFVTSRENRLREIDSMIESIKDEFNKYTGGVDKIQSKKKKPRTPKSAGSATGGDVAMSEDDGAPKEPRDFGKELSDAFESLTGTSTSKLVPAEVASAPNSVN